MATSLTGPAAPGHVITAWLPDMPSSQPLLYDDWDIARADIGARLRAPSKKVSWTAGTYLAWNSARALHLSISGDTVPVLLVEVPVHSAVPPADLDHADTETLEELDSV
jgi:hypothetical protein